MPMNIASRVVEYAQDSSEMKKCLSQADDGVIDDVIAYLTECGFGAPKILEVFADLLGGERAAQIWYDRPDSVGNPAWWRVIHDELTECSGPGINEDRPWLGYQRKRDNAAIEAR